MLTVNNFVKNNTLSFGGKFSLKDTQCNISGTRYYNKLVVLTKDYYYHPADKETKEQIEKQIKENTKGYSFSLIERDHFHTDGLYYVFQRVFPSEILENNTKQLKLSKNELISKNALYDTFSNYCYGVMDLKELDKNFVDKIKVKPIEEVQKMVTLYINGKNS